MKYDLRFVHRATKEPSSEKTPASPTFMSSVLDVNVADNNAVWFDSSVTVAAFIAYPVFDICAPNAVSDEDPAL